MILVNTANFEHVHAPQRINLSHFENIISFPFAKFAQRPRRTHSINALHVPGNMSTKNRNALLFFLTALRVKPTLNLLTFVSFSHVEF